MSYEGSIEQWWDEDADRLNALAVAARKYAVKIPSMKVDEEESRDCGRESDGRFGSGNKCAEDEGGGEGGGNSGGGGKSGSSSGDGDRIPIRHSEDAPKLPPPVSNNDISKLLERISQNPDGFTLDPASAEQPPDGIMVSEFANDSVRSVKIKASDIAKPEGAAAFAKWLSNNADLLSGANPDRFIGGWKTGEDFYIDIATRFPPDKAEDALEAGRKAGQLAVFNLGTFKETWVQYEDGDKRKPKEWDSGFSAARKKATVEQVYNPDSPSLDEEDHAAELTKHGKKTVRAYDLVKEASADVRKTGTGSEVRHSVEADADRDVPSVPLSLGEVAGSEGAETRSGVVSRQSGGQAGTVHGSATPSEEVQRLIDEARAAAGFLPRIEFRSVGRSVSHYSVEVDTIFVSPALSAPLTKDAQRRWLSQPNPILHEAANRYHAMSDLQSYISSESFSLSPQQRSVAVREVSRFAAMGGREFVAEALAGKWSGKTYSADVGMVVDAITNGKVRL